MLTNGRKRLIPRSLRQGSGNGRKPAGRRNGTGEASPPADVHFDHLPIVAAKVEVDLVSGRAEADEYLARRGPRTGGCCDGLDPFGEGGARRKPTMPMAVFAQHIAPEARRRHWPGLAMPGHRHAGIGIAVSVAEQLAGLPNRLDLVALARRRAVARGGRLLSFPPASPTRGAMKRGRSQW